MKLPNDIATANMNNKSIISFLHQRSKGRIQNDLDITNSFFIYNQVKMKKLLCREMLGYYILLLLQLLSTSVFFLQVLSMAGSIMNRDKHTMIKKNGRCNVQYIQNSTYQKLPYQLADNQFADMTSEEFKLSTWVTKLFVIQGMGRISRLTQLPATVDWRKQVTPVIVVGKTCMIFHSETKS